MRRSYAREQIYDWFRLRSTIVTVECWGQSDDALRLRWRDSDNGRVLRLQAEITFCLANVWVCRNVHGKRYR